MGCRLPCRIELFDDNSIKTIRYFDPESQRSQFEVDDILVLPAREFPLDNSHNLMTLFDYLPSNCVIFTLAGVLEKAEQFWQEVNQRYEQLDVDALAPSKLFLQANQVFAAIKPFAHIDISSSESNYNSIWKH